MPNNTVSANPNSIPTVEEHDLHVLTPELAELRSKYRVCIDRPIPLGFKPEAAEIAIEHNAANENGVLDLIKNVLPSQLGVSNSMFKLALFTGKMWKQRSALTVGFINGEYYQCALVQKYSAIWSNYCNIKFDFIDEVLEATIRVAFVEGDGSWSAIGTDALVESWFAKDRPTMNFGWLTPDTTEQEAERVIVHEFGHALGCIHEHQNPQGGIDWNEEAVYSYFMGPPNNWTREDVYSNVIQKYNLNQLNASRFDKNSIMAYSFPSEFTTDGTNIPWNNRLSVRDKTFIGEQYPLRRLVAPKPPLKKPLKKKPGPIAKKKTARR